MGKKAGKNRIEQFKKDMELLKEKYENTLIAERLGIDPGNLSSHYTGAKPPGADFLNKFYAIFELEIIDLRRQYDHGTTPSPELEEAPVRHIDGSQGYASQKNFDKIVDSNHLLAKSNADMAASQRDLALSQKDLAETNRKMVEAHLSIYDELKKASQRD